LVISAILFLNPGDHRPMPEYLQQPCQFAENGGILRFPFSVAKGLHFAPTSSWEFSPTFGFSHFTQDKRPALA
jgi:hypothetical protein